MNKQVLVSGIGALIIALVAVIIYILSGGQGSQPIISDYASCAKAGNATVESYPAECTTKDGRTFIQPAATESDTTALPAY